MVGVIPRGITELALYPITGVSTLGTGVLVTGPRSLNFNIDSTSDELEGGNAIQAKAPGPKSMSAGMEFSQIELAVHAIMFGGTVGTTGAAETLVTSHTQTNDPTPKYFQVIGQAPDTVTAGGAYRVTLFKMQATAGLDETLATSAWDTPTVTLEGTALGGNFIKREAFATLAPLTTTAPA